MAEQITIRPFQGPDWPAIREIVIRLWAMGLDCTREKRYGFLIGGVTWQERKTQAIHTRILAKPDDWFVSTLDGRVIGFCSLSVDATTRIGEVGHNGVHPDYQRRGVGSRQLKFMLVKLREAGMRIAELQTGLNDGHAPARRMYEAAGFETLFEDRRYILKL